MSKVSISTAAEQLQSAGYTLISGCLMASDVAVLMDEYDRLIRRASGIIAEARSRQIALGDYYKNRLGELMVVPEAANASQPCRLEYIAPSSSAIAGLVTGRIKRAIDEIMGAPFVLFKDKCNVKSPGGGAFPPHQDMAAYTHFPPRFHVTAAVPLDDATLDNGCLEMAADFLTQADSAVDHIETPFGVFPLFPFYDGGSRNGDIEEPTSQRFEWTAVPAARGDVMLFNSFVPHRSKANTSGTSRRMFFFTFNVAADGDHYHDYYERKRRDFGNPMFHVSTPTTHR